jgi:hypothetical protein
VGRGSRNTAYFSPGKMADTTNQIRLRQQMRRAVAQR